VRVSILARLVGRALHSIIPSLFTAKWFQSSPGWLAGRCTVTITDNSSITSFNPRPAGWPGAAITSRDRLNIVGLFQSSPGWLAGRCNH